MRTILRSLVFLVLGILVFSVGYYLILQGNIGNHLGAFLGFFPTMLGVYLIYRWELLYKKYRHDLFQQRLYAYRERNPDNRRYV